MPPGEPGRPLARGDLAGQPGRHVPRGQQAERPVGVDAATTATIPTPMLNTRSISGPVIPPRSASRPNTAGGVQVARSSTAPASGGSTRARFAASPPPVTCANACTSHPPASARQSLA